MGAFSIKMPKIKKKWHFKPLSSIKLEKIAFYFLIIIVLLDQYTMWSYVISSPIYGQGFGWATGGCCLLIVLLSKRFPKDTRTIMVLIALVAVLCFYAFVTQFKLRNFFVQYVSVIICMYLLSSSLYHNRNMGSFLTAFSNVILTIAIISLIFWVFGSLLNIMPGRQAVTYDWANDHRTSYTYYYLYFENPVQNRGERFSRNVGLFPEAPGYATFLTYGMLVEAVKRGNINRSDRKAVRTNTYKLIIYFITLLSTGSSKGIIVVMAVIALKYLFSKSRTSWRQVLKSMICIVGFIAVTAASLYLTEAKLSTGSGSVRIDDLLAGLKTWKQHFLFGAGYMNGDAIRANWTVLRENEGMSMGLAVLVGYGGLYFLLIYLGAAVFACKGYYFKRHIKEGLLVLIVLFIELFISNAAFETAWVFLIAAAYAAPTRGEPDKTDYIWREICSQA